jgi:hypothetical protein
MLLRNDGSHKSHDVIFQKMAYFNIIFVEAVRGGNTFSPEFSCVKS